MQIFTKKGFTLIELLVVVLIIGILAAIAVPQYQKAVMKTRFVQLKTMANSLANAEEVYYLANGKYAVRFDDLDISIPDPYAISSNESSETRSFPWGSCWIADDQYGSRSVCVNGDYGMNYYVFFRNSSKGSSVKSCRSTSTDLNSIQNKLCQEESGATSSYCSDSYCEWTWKY